LSFLFFVGVVDLRTGANEKPKNLVFKSFPKSVTVPEKESVEIECEILGKPSTGKIMTYRVQRLDNRFARGACGCV